MLLNELYVYPYPDLKYPGSKNIFIQFEFIQEDVGNSGFTLELQRKLSGRGDFETIAELDLDDEFYYIDRSLPGQVPFTDYEYKYILKDSDGTLVAEAIQVPVTPKYKKYFMELRSFLYQYLYDLKYDNGVECKIFVKKRWGQACSRCLNGPHNSASDSYCPKCFGTGFTGGFYDPIDSYINVQSMNTSESRGEEGLVKDLTYSQEISPFPILSIGDIIYIPEMNLIIGVDRVTSVPGVVDGVLTQNIAASMVRKFQSAEWLFLNERGLL